MYRVTLPSLVVSSSAVGDPPIRGDHLIEGSLGQADQAALPTRPLSRVRLARTMPVPVLVAVDVDPGALADVERQLTQRYERDYRVVTAVAPEEGLEELEQLAKAREEVAMVLVGEALFQGAGGELLERAHR